MIATRRAELHGTYAAHLAHALGVVDAALAASAAAGHPYDGVVFHAGSERYYHADDQPFPFKPVPHFQRLAPVQGPDHLIAYRPGCAPTLAQVVAHDYWHETPEPGPWLADHPYRDHLEVGEVEGGDAAAVALDLSGRLAFVGADHRVAARLGIHPGHVEPVALMASLDWGRGAKTAYEVACLRAAGRKAARGHVAVRELVASGLSERELNAAYLAASGQLDGDTPYGSIIGWDAAAAVLHYQSKRARAPAPGRVLLIDAGAKVLGYCSDITRTWIRGDVHPVFRALLDGMATLQRELVAAVRPGLSYVDLHRTSARAIGALLCETGVLTVGVDEALARGLVFPFFPHGLGHHLGLQVHDVGGKLAGPGGGEVPSPEDAPHLRTTRTLEAGHVVTIEPGLYFIPMLLARHAADPGIDHALVDALRDHGGIRIEDDVLVTGTGAEDLTRPWIGDHLQTETAG